MTAKNSTDVLFVATSNVNYLSSYTAINDDRLITGVPLNYYRTLTHVHDIRVRETVDPHKKVGETRTSDLRKFFLVHDSCTE